MDFLRNTQNLKKSSSWFWQISWFTYLNSKYQNHEQDFFKLCVLLKKSELYHRSKVKCFDRFLGELKIPIRHFKINFLLILKVSVDPNCLQFCYLIYLLQHCLSVVRFHITYFPIRLLLALCWMAYKIYGEHTSAVS